MKMKACEFEDIGFVGQHLLTDEEMVMLFGYSNFEAKSHAEYENKDG